MEFVTELAHEQMPHWVVSLCILAVALAAIVSIVTNAQKLRITSVLRAITHELTPNSGQSMKDQMTGLVVSVEAAARDSKLSADDSRRAITLTLELTATCNRIKARTTGAYKKIAELRAVYEERDKERIAELHSIAREYHDLRIKFARLVLHAVNNTLGNSHLIEEEKAFLDALDESERKGVNNVKSLPG